MFSDNRSTKNIICQRSSNSLAAAIPLVDLVDPLPSIDPQGNVIGLLLWNFWCIQRTGGAHNPGLWAREMPGRALIWFKPTAVLCASYRVTIVGLFSSAAPFLSLDHPRGSSPWGEIAGTEERGEQERKRKRREIPTRVRTRKKVA